MSAPEPLPLDRVLRLESALRRRLAADLHDNPLQALAAVAMGLELVRMQRGEDEDLREIEDAARDATRRLRRMLATITGPEESAPLTDALKAHVTALGGRCAIRVEAEPPERLRRAVALLAAEAASSGAAGVRVGAENADVVITIEGAESVDLELVMARAALLDGHCAPRGDSVEVRLPGG